MTTVAAAARPIAARNGMPTTVSPTSATTTVMAANRTALPAVPIARGTASAGGCPSSMFWRKGETMNRA